MSVTDERVAELLELARGRMWAKIGIGDWQVLVEGLEERLADLDVENTRLTEIVTSQYARAEKAEAERDRFKSVVEDLVRFDFELDFNNSTKRENQYGAIILRGKAIEALGFDHSIQMACKDDKKE